MTKKKTETETTGVVIFAFGHSYYGRMAQNLAASIRYKSDIPITLFYSGNAMAEVKYRELFTDVIAIPDDIISGERYFRAKTFIYDLSPYDRTLFLDADLLWFPERPIESFIENLMPHDFTMACEGFVDMETMTETTTGKYTWWMIPEQVGKVYKKTSGIMYQLRSEMIWFKRSETVYKFFEKAKAIFDKPRITVKPFAGSYPDEMAFNIATLITGMKPHTERFSPFYWKHFHYNRGLRTRTEIYAAFPAMSMGGNVAPDTEKALYNDLSKYYFNQSGRRQPYEWRDKKRFIRNRLDI